jgi:hypothetical protein
MLPACQAVATGFANRDKATFPNAFRPGKCLGIVSTLVNFPLLVVFSCCSARQSRNQGLQGQAQAPHWSAL